VVGFVTVTATACGGTDAGVTLRSGQTSAKLAEDRIQCQSFVAAHPDATTELAEASCLVERGYRAPLRLTHGPAWIGSVQVEPRGDAATMLGEFQACSVEAFKTPMPEISDKKVSGIFSNFFGTLFPRGYFKKAITSDDWALQAFAACLSRRGYSVSDVIRFK
jgi:hypothetical protein